MNRQQFQKQFSGELKQFLETPCGQSFLSALGTMRPPYEFPAQEHLMTENRGSMRGYELCMRNSLILTLPYEETKEVQPTYGVPDRSEPQP